MPAHFRQAVLRHREGVARLPRAPGVQGRCAEHAALGAALDARAGHRRLAGPSAAFLFDNTPAVGAAARASEFRRHSRGLYKEHLQAIGICATSYADADSVTFYACSPRRSSPGSGRSRKGARVQLTLDHLMASLAIPFLFRPILLHDQYYGDGAMRQTSPLSPAIHLGANRLLVIGVGDAVAAGPRRGGIRSPSRPSARCSASCSIRCSWTSCTRIWSASKRYNALRPSVRRIESLVSTPSQDLTEIARRHRHELPRSLRALLRTLGANNSGAGTQLLSYLLFERGFTRELIALGMSDARARAEELRAFLRRRRLSRAMPPVGSESWRVSTCG